MFWQFLWFGNSHKIKKPELKWHVLVSALNWNWSPLKLLQCYIVCTWCLIDDFKLRMCVISLPESGWILKAGMALSLCIKPYLTFPFAPSSASTACTCNTKVPVGWFSSTEACSRYCWHWNKYGGKDRQKNPKNRRIPTREVKCWETQNQTR